MLFSLDTPWPIEASSYPLPPRTRPPPSSVTSPLQTQAGSHTGIAQAPGVDCVFVRRGWGGGDAGGGEDVRGEEEEDSARKSRLVAEKDVSTEGFRTALPSAAATSPDVHRRHRLMGLELDNLHTQWPDPSLQGRKHDLDMQEEAGRGLQGGGDKGRGEGRPEGRPAGGVGWRKLREHFYAHGLRYLRVLAEDGPQSRAPKASFYDVVLSVDEVRTVGFRV
jgi:hypothetical protein